MGLRNTGLTVAALEAAEIQAAAAAAISAAHLPSAGAIQGMVETGVASVLSQQIVGPYGSLFTLMNPGDPFAQDPNKVGPLSGATAYTIVAAGSGFTVLYGFTITSSETTTLQWYADNAGAPVTGPHPLAAGAVWDHAATSRENYNTGLERALVLKSSNAAAVLYVDYWVRVAHP